jgi:hypothetical protein
MLAASPVPAVIVTHDPPPMQAPPPAAPVPGPLGVVGLAVAAGVFGVRKLVRCKPADVPTEPAAA